MIYFQKLFFKRIVKSIGFWFGFVFTLVLLPVFGTIYNSSDNNAVVLGIPIQSAAAVIFTGISIIFIQSWGIVFSTYKNSFVLNNLKINGVTTQKFILQSILSTFYLFAFLSLFFMAYFILLFHADVILSPYTLRSFLKTRHFGFMFSAFINLYLLSFGVSFFIASVTKSINSFNSVSNAYLILFIFFGGSTTPVQTLRGPDSVDALRIISYFVPHSYVSFGFVEALNTVNTDINVKTVDTTLNTFLPLIFSSILIPVGYYYSFRW